MRKLCATRSRRTMGRNKQLRKQLTGHMKNIRRHEEKMERELRKPEPDMRLVSKWERDIDRARAK